MVNIYKQKRKIARKIEENNLSNQKKRFAPDFFPLVYASRIDIVQIQNRKS